METWVAMQDMAKDIRKQLGPRNKHLAIFIGEVKTMRHAYSLNGGGK